MNDTDSRWADWVRNILSEHREHELLALFEHELATAEDPHHVIRHWAGRAGLIKNPLTEAELDALERAKSGDFSGFWEPDGNGGWRRPQ